MQQIFILKKVRILMVSLFLSVFASNADAHKSMDKIIDEAFKNARSQYAG